MTAAILVSAVLIWGAIRSWLASVRAKDQAGRALGQPAQRGYRLAYNTFAVVSFLPILVLIRALPDRTLYLVSAPWSYAMLAGEALALILLLLALPSTDVLQFVGLRQMLGGEAPPRLVKNGFYRWVRHPLYMFGLLILWLTPIMTVNLLAVIATLTVYILVAVRFEEARLELEFGEEYRKYRERTPMLVPGLRLGQAASQTRAGMDDHRDFKD